MRTREYVKKIKEKGEYMQVYGMNVLKELDKKKIRKVYTSRIEVIKYCENNHIKYEHVNNNYLSKLSNNNHQGVIIEYDDFHYGKIEDVKGNLVVILDHIEDPHNFGAIIRTCAACGVKSIIIPKDRSVKVTDTVVKTSVGTINYVDIIMTSNIVNAIKKLQQMGYFIYGADMAGDNFMDVSFSEKKVLIIGNEGSGISRLVKDNCDTLIKIPINEQVESLNASVAAGILIYNLKNK